MELYLFFLLLSYAKINIVCTDLSDEKSAKIMTIREKGSISLQCVISGHEEVAWYRLSSYTLTLLISAQKSHAENSLPVYYNKYESRFVLRPNSDITTAEFTIMDLTKEDLGVYFCGITAEPAQMHFGRATILQFEIKRKRQRLKPLPKNHQEKKWRNKMSRVYVRKC
ncbi:hypothetical protein AMELA_G00165200 [Ameiurus melas]|uniref:Ig-like domain-containing protein n=1 Tax=Ameiurus melas TaxID=219545 RepID=A0A7J6AI95_AMEME|nr:hypothetical protein AMELA_G00165200 [Ameiurus melas]